MASPLYREDLYTTLGKISHLCNRRGARRNGGSGGLALLVLVLDQRVQAEVRKAEEPTGVRVVLVVV